MKSLKTVSIKLPVFVLKFFEGRNEELQKRACELLVLDMVRRHEISQGKGAELLNMNRWDFGDLMSKNHVPHIDIMPEELDRQLEDFKEWERNATE